MFETPRSLFPSNPRLCATVWFVAEVLAFLAFLLSFSLSWGSALVCLALGFVLLFRDVLIRNIRATCPFIAPLLLFVAAPLAFYVYSISYSELLKEEGSSPVFSAVAANFLGLFAGVFVAFFVSMLVDILTGHFNKLVSKCAGKNSAEEFLKPTGTPGLKL